MSASPEQSGGSPETVTEFFDRQAHELLERHTDYVMHTGFVFIRSIGHSLDVLHLLDPRPTQGRRLGYHYVYKTNDLRSGVVNTGMVISSPKVYSDDLGVIAGRGKFRHYKKYESGLLIRKDRLSQRDAYEFLQEIPADPQASDDPVLKEALNELHNDMLQLQMAIPIKPDTLVLDFLRI